MFEFNYELNDDDYYEFNKFHIYNAPMHKKELFLARILPPVIFILISLIVGNVIIYITAGILSIGCLVSFKKLNNYAIKRRIQRMKKTGKLPIEDNVILRFHDDGFVEITEKNESKFSYTCIERVENAESAIYIYTGAIQAFIIPHHVFKDKIEEEMFLEFINQKKG